MTDARPQITPMENGPLRVQGLTTLAGGDGPIECKPTIALCRCGGSRNKPFCDGTHSRIDFSSAKVGGANADQRSDYAGKSVTIHDNRAICAHAAYCTNELPDVFRMKQKPWIDPDGASAEAVIELVSKCPSGALSYSVDGEEHRDRDGDPSVFVAPRGPYVVRGSCGLDDATWGDGASQEHYTLCRCGGSKNKPFCDGSHWRVWKDGEDVTTPDA